MYIAYACVISFLVSDYARLPSDPHVESLPTIQKGSHYILGQTTRKTNKISDKGFLLLKICVCVCSKEKERVKPAGQGEGVRERGEGERQTL